MTMASSSSSSNNNQSGALGVGVCIAGGNNDLWRECVAWLTRCKIIPADHKANWPDSEIRVLALTLRDGVLLCNLVIYLDASSMDPRDFNRKPQMAQAEAEAAKFEEAISACSFGRFNLFLMLIVLPGTAAILFASSTMSYVLPSAQCDLKLSIMQKGYLNMITYVGMLVSVLPWAAASDIYGRRKVLITSHICDAIFVLCSALCPEFYSLLLFKLLNDENWIFSIAGGFSALITYVSEVHGSKHRQHLILFVGLSITFASVVLPILAIIILPYRWEFNFLWMTFRAWNLFIVVVACPSLLCGVGFIYFPESPKYLMYNKKYKAGEAVFEKIFHLNTRKPAEEFRVKLPADPPSDGTGQMDWKGFKEGLKNLKIMVRREYLWQAIIVSLTDTAVAMCQNTLRLWMPQLFALSKNFENENNYSITQLLDKNKEEEQFIEEEAPNSNKCFMFLCCKNIKLFLDVCRNHFGLRDSDLFEPTMLYDLTNFHRVLITLSKLSQCRKVQQLHPELLGFNIQLSPSERSHSDEAIYKDLHSTTNDNVACHDHINTKEEEVYQDLCALQRSSRTQITSATSFEQRDYVIRELIDTESNYLDVLNALIAKFMIPLERYLNPVEIHQIFPRIRELADIHTRFLDKLRDSLLPNTKQKMSAVFLEFREPFLIYGDYCSCLLSAIDFLGDVCKKNQIIEQLVQQCEREYNVGKLQLRDILSVPMQRILKYHLLLDKLVKETSPMHEDYRALERAKEAMIDVSQYINEVKRDSDHLVIIQKVKDSIIDLQLLQNGNDLLQYGRLLLDGEIHIKAHEDQKTKLRYAFVFDKILILVKPLHSKTGDMQYTYRDSHYLCDYRVEQSLSRRTLGRDTRFKCQLLLARKSGKTAFTLYLKSEPERDKWRKALTEAMENLDPPGCRNTDHKMEIYTFDSPTTCRHCSKFLKGRIHQGYRCKVCEIPVHKGCISSTGRCKQNPISVPPPVCDRQLSEFNWFVGTMDRDTAATKLENRRVGTYLLRVRPQGASNPHETMYALSLKTDDHVIKHMKINQETDGESVRYCLSSRRHFKTIVELVSYYERNDLGENFAGLNQSLQWPFREVIATAIYDFEPKGNNQLQLKTGCQVLVIGKDGDSKGWWRGKIGDTVGYFPKEYVQTLNTDGPIQEDI